MTCYEEIRDRARIKGGPDEVRARAQAVEDRDYLLGELHDAWTEAEQLRDALSDALSALQDARDDLASRDLHQRKHVRKTLRTALARLSEWL